MTEERQPNTELREKAREFLIECPEGKHLAFLWANGTIVPHFAENGLKCPASYTVYKESATKTVNPEPAHGWKGRALELEGWLNDAASAAGNCDLDSVGDAIRKLQAEAQQQIEELKQERDEQTQLYIKAMLCGQELEKQLAEARIELEAAEQRGDEYKAALAEARIELEAAEQRGAEQMINCDKCGFGHKTFEEMNACKSWEEMQAEIHNRFCGENGEPCQVCKLKAEREEGK